MLRRLRRSKMIGGALTSLLPAVESATSGAAWFATSGFLWRALELFFFLIRRQCQVARLANRLTVRGSSSSTHHAQMLAAGGSLPQIGLLVQRQVLCLHISLLKWRRGFSSICLSYEIACMSIDHVSWLKH